MNELDDCSYAILKLLEVGLVPRPLPGCNIEKLGVAWVRG